MTVSLITLQRMENVIQEGILLVKLHALRELLLTFTPWCF